MLFKSGLLSTNIQTSFTKWNACLYTCIPPTLYWPLSYKSTGVRRSKGQRWKSSFSKWTKFMNWGTFQEVKHDRFPLQNELGSKNIELFHNPGGERSRISSWKCKNDKRSNEEEEATQKPNTNRRRSCPSLYLLFPCHCRAKGWCPPHATRHPSHPRCKKPIQTESTVDIG